MPLMDGPLVGDGLCFPWSVGVTGWDVDSFPFASSLVVALVSVGVNAF